MISNEKMFVDCPTHGHTDVAFVCGHLVRAKTGPAVGFHQADFDPENRDWGDLNGWCDQCDAIHLAEGEWNEASEAFAGVTLVCSACFFDLKARHGIPNRGK